MIFNWKNIFRFRKVQVISLELTETGVRFHFSRLKYGKAKVKVLTEFENISKDVLLKELRDRVHLMNSEEFTYFKTLLKFDYAFIEKQN